MAILQITPIWQIPQKHLIIAIKHLLQYYHTKFCISEEYMNIQQAEQGIPEQGTQILPYCTHLDSAGLPEGVNFLHRISVHGIFCTNTI